MQVAKPFLRDGVVLQPGDPVPDGLDKATLDHYKRHGMVAEPTDTKPRRQAGKTAPKPPPGPNETKPAGPAETKPASGPDNPAGPGAGGAGQSEQQPPAD
ncbi:hypothetical protein LJR118_000606 [Acidovorax sp. LjRoot118]|uniref:hypothetical protein n=1 Tax=Acidovorax sp. LjRoot118 TaxID=3342256 RepID=UPI003ECDCCEB